MGKQQLVVCTHHDVANKHGATVYKHHHAIVYKHGAIAYKYHNAMLIPL